MIYEVINPSDPVCFVAEDQTVAIVAGLILGDGQYGLEADGEEVMPILIFGAANHADRFLEPMGISLEHLGDYLSAHSQELAQALQSCLVVQPKNYEITMAGLREKLREREAAGHANATLRAVMEDWNEDRRSSMNNICGRAFRVGDNLLKKFPPKAERKDDAPTVVPEG